MAQDLSPDTEIAGWLTILGVDSLCQCDVLVFLYRHQITLLSAADLARLLGYASNPIVMALDALESRELVARSRLFQGARLYQFRVPPDPSRADAFARLQALAADRTGRVRVAQQLRPDRTPEQTLEAAKHFLAEAQQHLRVVQRRADEFAERRAQWRKAI